MYSEIGAPARSTAPRRLRRRVQSPRGRRGRSCSYRSSWVSTTTRPTPPSHMHASRSACVYRQQQRARRSGRKSVSDGRHESSGDKRYSGDVQYRRSGRCVRGASANRQGAGARLCRLRRNGAGVDRKNREGRRIQDRLLSLRTLRGSRTGVPHVLRPELRRRLLLTRRRRTALPAPSLNCRRAHCRHEAHLGRRPCDRTARRVRRPHRAALPRPGTAHRRAGTRRPGVGVGGPLLSTAVPGQREHAHASATGEGGKGDDLFARRYDDMIPAAYDVHERVRTMDEDGVWAELLFPTFPRFGGNRFLEADDQDLALACVAGMERLDDRRVVRRVPGSLHPADDDPVVGPAARGARDRAVRGEGREGDHLRREPVPDRAAVVPDAGTGTRCSRPRPTPACRCRCTSARRRGCCSPSPDATPSVGIALCGVNSMSALGDLIFSGALESHPNCKIALSEGGAGWVPYVLERLDYTWQRSRYEGVNCSRLPVRGVRAALLGLHGRRSLRGASTGTSSVSTS